MDPRLRTLIVERAFSLEIITSTYGLLYELMWGTPGIGEQKEGWYLLGEGDELLVGPDLILHRRDKVLIHEIARPRSGILDELIERAFLSEG